MKSTLLSLLIVPIAFLLSQERATAQCYVSCHSLINDTLSWALNGCSLQSYGCAPIDPTIWIAGNGPTATVTFANEQTNPSIRVWGMNDDDSASVSVNGSAYPLNSSTASYNEKVVCGLSPGPDGIIFANGKITGANTGPEGNYSYQDLTINSAGISTITITGAGGAGWGVAGTTVSCSLEAVPNVNEISVSIFPNPTTGLLIVDGIRMSSSEITVMNDLGHHLRKIIPENNVIDISDLRHGVYFLRIISDNNELMLHVVKL